MRTLTLLVVTPTGGAYPRDRNRLGSRMRGAALSESFRLGQAVHALLIDAPGGRCAPGWVTGWDVVAETATVQGFRDPRAAESFGQGFFLGTRRPHAVPLETYRAPDTVPIEDAEEGPTIDLVASFHLPDECPWRR